MESFDIVEVFRVAQQIEIDGARFYRESARRLADGPLSEKLLWLAAEEDKHLHTFQQMEADLTGEERKPASFDTPEEAALFFNTLVSPQLFDVEMASYEKPGGPRTARGILRWALAAEKNSAVFYVMLKKFAPTAQGEQQIERILREELQHVALMTRELANLKD